MQNEEIQELIKKYLNGSASADERLQLADWYRTVSEENIEWFADVQQEEVLLKAAMYAKIEKEIGIVHAPTRTLWPHIAAVAAAVAAIVFGVWFYTATRHPDNDGHTELVSVPQDIAPGKQGATLTLANGEVIVLSGNKKGVIIGDGKIAYSASSLRGVDPETSSGQAVRQPRDEIASIPGNDVIGLIAGTTKGQTYQFTLPDGTHVWLNADSKISFPSQFIGKERKIILDGEAYFAVAHNAKQPFKVESKGQVVQDIGTEFNISAYADEPSIKTTLVEGSASVNGVLIAPNQQAVLNNNKIMVKPANIEEFTSWKNGYFRFNDEALGSIMTKLSRWYDIEVVYVNNKIAEEGFTGTITRDKNLSQVLSMLEKTKAAHFKIEGRRVTVSE